MSALSAFRSVAYIATIASVVGVLSAPVFANDVNTASALRELGNASQSAEALSSNAQSGRTARAQHPGASQQSTQRGHSSENVVNSSRPFDFEKLGHN